MLWTSRRRPVRDLYARELTIGPELARAENLANLRRLAAGEGVAASNAARVLANLDDGADDDEADPISSEPEPVRVFIPCDARDCNWGRGEGRLPGMRPEGRAKANAGTTGDLA
jgi:hypothetical protein